MINKQIKMKKHISLLLLILILFVSVSKAQDTDEDDTPIKIDTLLLTIPLTVSDKAGRSVTGLKKENFSIFHEGEEQEIDFFFNEEAPMNVAILIDTSYSTKDVLDNIQKSARDFIKVFRPEDKGMIVTFDYRTKFLSGLTSDQKQLAKAINQARIAEQSGSDMHEAISHVVKNHFASLKGRKAIIVLTDGMVIGRTLSTQKVLNILQKSDTLFYPIIFKTDFYEKGRTKTTNNNKPLQIKMLEFLAEETTGRFYEKDAANLKEAFQGIAEELKKQYVLGFYPQYTESQKTLGHIRIAVDRQGFTVRAKKVSYLKALAEEEK